MNVNLLAKFVQYSKKYSHVNNLLRQDILSTTNFIRHNGSFFKALTYRKCAPPNTSIICEPFQRCYCKKEDNKNGSPPPSTHKLPPLMEFPSLVWPSVFKSLRNLILTTFIIKPYFDQEFNIPDFVKGSKKAVEVISHRLSKGDNLDGLVSSDIIPNLQKTVSQMTLGQRDLVPIQVEDIYFSFPYQVGVIFNEDIPQNQQRFVEITMVYHVLRGLASMRAVGEEPPLNLGMLPEYQDKISICNYRFIKEFTQGVESDWTVNLLNHFRPIDDEI